VENIENILRSFESISLDEMDNVKLMDRIDTKFVYPVERVPEILSDAKEFYRILEIENKRLFLYKSLYLDTFDNEMFMDHHNGNLNRYKVRFRDYVDSNRIFLEVKFKTNKGRTIKKRIKRKQIDKLDSRKAKEFVESRTPYLYESLEPKMWCIFSRLTLVHKSINERVTLDLNLRYENDYKEKDMSFISVAEVKQELYAENSDLRQILLSYRILPTAFSKYCMGRTLLDHEIKKNRFKTKLITLNKLHHDNRLVHLIG
jgi:hypothetical protein